MANRQVNTSLKSQPGTKRLVQMWIPVGKLVAEQAVQYLFLDCCSIECFGKRWPVLHFLRHHDSVIKALDNGYKSHDSLESKEKNRGFVRLNYGASQMNKKLEFFSSMAVAFIVLILVFLCIRFSGQGKFATHGGTIRLM